MISLTQLTQQNREPMQQFSKPLSSKIIKLQLEPLTIHLAVIALIECKLINCHLFQVRATLFHQSRESAPVLSSLNKNSPKSIKNSSCWICLILTKNSQIRQ